MQCFSFETSNKLLQLQIMKKLIFTILLLCGGSASVFAQLNPAFTARLQTVLDSVSNRYKIKGISAAVVVPGVGTWKGVHGISSKGHPVTSDMLFGIGSNTKTYTSCIMLLLQEQGMLSLNDTIGKWIHNKPNISGKITIRQLLNHTSGVFSFTENPTFNDSLLSDFSRRWTPDEMLQFVQAPYFAPGKSWQYSNTNYVLAGMIIEQVTGVPYQNSLHKFILDPQGFKNTILFPYETTSSTIANPWSTLNIKNYPEFDLLDSGYVNDAMFSFAWTAGGIMATAEENAHFWDALISGNILSAASMKEMRHYIPIGFSMGHRVGYGLGIFMYDHFINGHTVFSHGGTNIGYINENIVDSTSGVTISVLTNQDSVDNNVLILNVIRPLQKVTEDMKMTAMNEQPADDNTSISFYPNPAAKNVMLNTNGLHGSANLQMFDISGKEVLSKNNIAEGVTAISLENLKPGLYIVRIISSEGHVYAQKLQVRE